MLTILKKVAASAKSILGALKSPLLRYISRLREYFFPWWKKFEFGLVRLFALADHSSMRTPRIIIRISIVFFVIFIFWASLFHIDQVVNAQGQVIADSRTQVVQVADGGILVEMKIREGDSVERGQVIAVLEKDRALAAFTESYGKVTALRMTVARLQAELAGSDLSYGEQLQEKFSDLVDTQMNLFKKRRRAYLERMTVLKDTVKLANQELAMNLPLEKSGDISRADILKLRRALNEAKGNLAEQENKYFQDASTELNKAQEDLNAQEQILADREQLLQHTDIVAPATGVIKSIRVNTFGGVLRQGDELLQILPTESALVIEAKVKPSDMANIKVGLPAKVKLDAYDYSIFGTMNGHISYVSADSLTEDTKTGPLTYYRVKVSIEEKELQGKNAREIDVRPGMTATIDIRTGNRSILAYIFKPVVKTLGGSFGER